MCLILNLTHLFYSLYYCMFKSSSFNIPVHMLGPHQALIETSLGHPFCQSLLFTSLHITYIVFMTANKSLN